MAAAVICRICGSDDQLKHITDGGEKLLNLLSSCANVSIQFDDFLPKHICQHCEQGLEFSYRLQAKLRRQGEETEKRALRALQRREEEADHEIAEAVEKEVFPETIEESSKDSVIIIDDAEEEQQQEEEQLEEEKLEEEEGILECYETLDDANVVSEEAQTSECFVYVDEELYLVKDDEETLVLSEDESVESEQLAGNMKAENCDTYEPYRIDLIEEEGVTELSPEQVKGDSKDLQKMQVVSYTCPTCMLVLTTQAEYRQHIKEHGTERFNCIQCNKWFPTRFRLQKHEQCHNDVEMHQCPQCARSYRLRCNLVRHIRNVHEFQRSFECSVCAESFGRSDVLKNHMLTHEPDKNFVCKDCLRSFKSQRYLESHMKTHLPKSEKPKPTKTTKINSISKDSASDVDEKEVASSKRTYYCVHCGKVSKHHFTHKNHLRTHTQERPYACETCSKRFRTMAAMITHERIHVDSRPYQCEQCLVSFRQQSHLNEHRLLHEGKMPHVCNVCNKAFTKKNNLHSHMLVHSNERPFKCSTCDSQFKKLSLLKRHAASVHGNSFVQDQIGSSLAESNGESTEEHSDPNIEQLPHTLSEEGESAAVNSLSSGGQISHLNFVSLDAEETAIEVVLDNSLHVMDDNIAN